MGFTLYRAFHGFSIGFLDRPKGSRGNDGRGGRGVRERRGGSQSKVRCDRMGIEVSVLVVTNFLRPGLSRQRRPDSTIRAESLIQLRAIDDIEPAFLQCIWNLVEGPGGGLDIR